MTIVRMMFRPWAVLSLLLLLVATPARAQEQAGPGAAMDEAQRKADAALASETQSEPAQKAAAPKPPGPNLLELQLQGGPLMIPIGLLSIVVIAFSFERAFALRRSKVLPPPLVAELGLLAEAEGGLDPRRAYHACQKYPSAAATILRTALLKVGRPQMEVQQMVRETSDREAAKLYANVRPLTLALAIGPLLGLLGTIQGIIEAFHQTATGISTGNRAAELAGGIYHALITTFAGICVAIPAAVLAHLFEGRIQKLCREIDELVQGILPQLERYEGKLRVGSRASRESRGEESEASRRKQPSS
jgi:biopolymer transport protein ExbB